MQRCYCKHPYCLYRLPIKICSILVGDGGCRITLSTYSKNGNKTETINVKKLLRAQNDTFKTANITDTIFDRKR